MAQRTSKKTHAPSSNAVQKSKARKSKKTAARKGSVWVMTPEQREAFDSLDITNAAVFALVMMRNPDLCRRVIEASIGRTIDEIDVVTTERTILTGIGAKGVRLDAMAYSGDEVFDVEMQVSGVGDIPRRIRYYHSAMDVEFLGGGDDYGSLPDSYVIFIGATSLLGDAFEPTPARTFRMVDEESGLPLGDGAATVVLDATAWEEAGGELRGMLELVRRGEDAAALADEAGIAAALHGAVERAKESEADKMIMSAATQMELMERAIEGGKEEIKRKEEEIRRKEEEIARSQEELARKDEELARNQEEIARKEKESAGFSQLIKALLADKRYEDAEKAADDPEFRAQLLHEYGIHFD